MSTIDALKGMNAVELSHTLNQLAAYLGARIVITFENTPAVTTYDVTLMSVGPSENKIRTIKCIREFTGLGLGEAHEVYKAAQVKPQGLNVPGRQGLDAMINALAAWGAKAVLGDNTAQYVVTLTGYKDKIDAIRAVRQANYATLSLGEAKLLVESCPIDFPAILDATSVENMRAHFRAAGVEIAVRQVDVAPRYAVRMLSWDKSLPLGDVYHVFSDSLALGEQILAKLPYNIPCSGVPLQMALDVVVKLRDVGVTARVVEVEQ